MTAALGAHISDISNGITFHKGLFYSIVGYLWDAVISANRGWGNNVLIFIS